jgi:hypothetical protein
MGERATRRKGVAACRRSGVSACGRMKSRGPISLVVFVWRRQRLHRPFAVSPIRRSGVSSCVWFCLAVVCYLSYAERQPTPVAGGDVFKRLTLTLTFIDWLPAPLKVPRTGAASLASRPNETAICCSPHQQLLVGSNATQVWPGTSTSTHAWVATEPTNRGEPFPVAGGGTVSM